LVLQARDLRRVLAFVADAHDADGPEALDVELLDRLAGLVGCEYATYQEFDWPRRVVTAYIPCSYEGPEAVRPPYVPGGFWTGELREAGRPRFAAISFRKLSDDLGRRQRERFRDEDTYNGEFRIVDRLGFHVGVQSAGKSGWLGFDSQVRDFDERDRALARTLRPQVTSLRRRAILRKQAGELVGALEHGTGAAVVVFEAGGRIGEATVEARRMLAAWFGARDGRLPGELREWLELAAPGDAYVKRRNGSILTVEAAGGFTVRLRERRSGDSRLTPREREVLGLVSEGLSNGEVAKRLWVAQSTVAKHLEQAYSKLGVHSRTAAIVKLARHSD
jgi:DNA-binding CsgD family transcriptional regulator